MKELDIDALVNANYRMCTLIGIMVSYIANPSDCKVHKDWIMKSVENVIYHNKPLPEFPK